jgi:hypothetical protein
MHSCGPYNLRILLRIITTLAIKKRLKFSNWYTHLLTGMLQSYWFRMAITGYAYSNVTLDIGHHLRYIPYSHIWRFGLGFHMQIFTSILTDYLFYFPHLTTTLRGSTFNKIGIYKLCHFRERVRWSNGQSWPGTTIPVLQISKAKIPLHQATNTAMRGNQEENFIWWLSVQKAGLPWCEIRRARVCVRACLEVH